MNTIQGFLDGLRPERIMTVTEWANENRVLSRTASAEHGRYRSSRTPYAEEIMDALSTHASYQKVVNVAGAQIGKTEMGLNWAGYIMDVAPGPMMVVMPTDENVKRNTATRIDPMIEATPKLRQKVAAPRSRNAKNTTHEKSFTGGILVMTGANSASGLKSTPIKYLMLDEIDEYPSNLDGQGSVLSLAEARTKTFPKKKIYMASTPTVEGKSAIWAEFELTDQRHYHVPCPHCGTMQELVFDQIRYEGDKPDTATYECIGCNEQIEERAKTKMLADGQWIAHAPQNASRLRVGFRINSLYSPVGWYSWANAARDYEEALKDKSGQKMITFINTVEAKTHKAEATEADWDALFSRRSDYQIGVPPSEVCFLTAGVDVQGNRIECEVVGWCHGKRTYSVDYVVIPGDTATDAPWQKLAERLATPYTAADGRSMVIAKTCVDTGHNTNVVYDFCSRYPSGNVVPIKGQDSLKVSVSPPKAIHYTSDGKRVQRTVSLWGVGVSILKAELYGWLGLRLNEDGSTPPGWCEFPQYAPEYFKGITAEKLVRSESKGFYKYSWERTYRANEPLDCRVYARAAATMLQVDRFTDADYDKMAAMYARVEAKPTERSRKKRNHEYGDFWKH